MRPFKLVGRYLPTDYSNYSYSNDMGVNRHKRSISIWLILLVSIFGIGAVGYFKVELSKRAASVASASPNQSSQPTKAVPSSVIAPQQLKSQTRLESQIENWGQTNSAQKWGIVVQQLSGGNISVNYRAESSFHPGGLETILMDQPLIDGYNYTTWSQPLGSTGSSISECVTKMIKDSDNKCATAISNLVGSRNINYQLKKAGLTNTDLASLNNKWHTTAGDTDLYLNKFYQSTKSPEALQFILSLMSQQTNRDGIPDGSPNCKVYDKAGELNGYRNDAAVVVCPNNISYSLVVLSQGGSYKQISNMASLVNKFLIN